MFRVIHLIAATSVGVVAGIELFAAAGGDALGADFGLAQNGFALVVLATMNVRTCRARLGRDLALHACNGGGVVFAALFAAAHPTRTGSALAVLATLQALAALAREVESRL